MITGKLQPTLHEAALEKLVKGNLRPYPVKRCCLLSNVGSYRIVTFFIKWLLLSACCKWQTDYKVRLKKMTACQNGYSSLKKVDNENDQ